MTDNIELWRPVVGFEGVYEVSNHGRVRSLTRTIFSGRGHARRTHKGRILKPARHPDGHLFVGLHNNGKVQAWIHRLVLEAFVGPCPPGMQCRHFPDGDPTNNRLDNLRWGTALENMRDRVIQGASNHGKPCPDSVRRAVAQSNRTRVCTDETRRKRSENAKTIWARRKAVA